jgi:hypothetical protein
VYVSDFLETCLFQQRTIGEFSLCVKIHAIFLIISGNDISAIQLDTT